MTRINRTKEYKAGDRITRETIINASTGLYWWEFEKTDGSIRKQYDATPINLPHAWALWEQTFQITITADSIEYGKPIPSDYSTLYLCSFTTRTKLWPLPDFMVIRAINREKARIEREQAEQAELDANGQGKCDDCSEVFDLDDLESITVDGTSKLVCESCMDEYYYCEHCESHASSDDIREVHTRRNSNYRWVDEMWCEDCFDRDGFTCSDCGEHFSDATSYERIHGEYVCDSCLENYSCCENCNTWMSSDDSFYSESSEQTLCESCYQEAENEDSCLIHDYSYKPKPIFHGGAGVTHYGVELEVTCSSDYAEDVLESLGGEEHAYLKKDSSIDGAGFEIVTHPHTMRTMKQAWEGFFNSLPRRIKADGNGMHVHIQRKYLTVFQIQKIQSFLNLESNKAFVEMVAGRDTSSWARIKPELGKISAKSTLDRYQALNLSNEKTIEVRIFRGTVKRSRFMANLEFCEALVRFTVDRSYQALNYQEFCKFVRANRKDWMHLDAFLVGKGHLAAVPTKEQRMEAKQSKQSQAIEQAGEQAGEREIEQVA